MYAFILTRSSLGLLHNILYTFVPELWPLIYIKVSFMLNILTLEHKWTEFHMCFHIDKIYVGIVTLHFLLICTRVMALDLLQNFFSAQYLKNKWTIFDQTLYNYLCWQDLRLDC